jgi:hypothetical protein
VGDGLDLCPAFEKHVWEIAQRRPLTCCANSSFHQNSIAHCQRIIFPTCFRRDGHFLRSDSRLVDLLHALIIPHVLMTCRFRIRTRNLRHAQHSGRCTRYTPPTLRSTIAALSCSARATHLPPSPGNRSTFQRPKYLGATSDGRAISKPTVLIPIAAMQGRDPMPHNSEM